MTNIVLITNGSRPHLLEQTLRTLFESAPRDQFNVTLVLDGIDAWCVCKPIYNVNLSLVITDPACHVIGRLKNVGAYWSEKQFGRGEWLCFIDDDIAVRQNWLAVMIEQTELNNAVRITGGCRHPFHGVNQRVGSPSFLKDGPCIEITDAVAGYCHFMRWSTWDRFGPYDAHAKGTGQSEDFAICRKIVDAGGKVGYIHPPVMAHCGITDSNGKTILGAELIERVPNIIYE